MTAHADAIAMLLSSDWLVSAYPHIGLEGQANTTALRQASRDVVRRLVNGCENYWEVDFGFQRIVATKTEVLGILGKFAAGSEFREVANDIISTSQLPVSDDALLLDTLKAGLQKISELDSDPTLSCAYQSAPELPSFDLCATQWDQYLASLTPDLPSYLADFMCTHVVGWLELRANWQRLTADLSAERHEAVKRQLAGFVRATIEPSQALPRWLT